MIILNDKTIENIYKYNKISLSMGSINDRYQ